LSQGDKNRPRSQPSTSPNGQTGAHQEPSNLITAPDLPTEQPGKPECMIGQTEQSLGAKHPGNLLKAPFLVGPMMKRYTAENNIGGFVGQGKRLSRCDLKGSFWTKPIGL
jgi:hypothetical protein